MATLTISTNAIIKAGTGVGAVPPTAWNGFIEEAEGFLSGITKFDLVGNWVTISAGPVMPMLSEYCARSAAVEGVAYDMKGYGTEEGAARIHGEDIINVHIFRMNEIIKLLEADGVQHFMGI